MNITNAQRNDLYTGLEEVLGQRRAELMMDYLPPNGWTDVASAKELGAVREDVEVLKADVAILKADVASLHSVIELQGAEMRAFLFRQQLWHTIALIASLGTLMAIFQALST
ncbi:MAG: hypothetical protein ACK5O2_01575 [Microthrixaceae bacterium]